ncbi:MAG: PAS domain S-box protein [Reyranellaceae bacterium]
MRGIHGRAVAITTLDTATPPVGQFWQRRSELRRAGLPLFLGSALLGAVCLVALLLTFLVALPAEQFERSHAIRTKVSAFEKVNHRLMKTVVGQANDYRPIDAFGSVEEAWSSFQAALTKICAELPPAPGIETLRSACEPDSAVLAVMAQGLRSLDPKSRPLDPAVLRQLMAMRDDVVVLRDWVSQLADEIGDVLLRDYERGLFAVATGAIGFALSGFALVFLGGRASIRQVVKTREAEVAHELLLETIESLPAGVVVYDRQERLVLANAMAAAVSPVLGRPESKGMTFEQILAATAELNAPVGVKLDVADIPKWLDRFRRGIRYVQPLQDGRWIEWSSRKTPSGCVVGLRTDVTAAKDQEAELIRARGRYQALVESLSDTVYALDVEGRFLYATPTVLTLLGVPAGQLLGRRLVDFIVPEDVERVRADGRAFYRSNSQEVHQRLLRMKTVDGEVRHVEVRYRKPFRAASDSAVQIGVMRDVTVSIRMVQRLEDERSRLKSIVESSGAMLLLTDRNLKIEMANHEFWTVHGLDPSEAIGRPMTSFVGCVLDPGLLLHWQNESLTATDARPVQYAKTVTDSEGRRRTFVITAKPVVGDDRRLQQIVFLAVDDTERLETEKALFDSDRMATLGEMAATVAHDLRQPLQVINLACESARDEVHDKMFVLSKLDLIDSQIFRARDIIEDLRLYARGAGADTAEPFAVEPAVRSAIALTSHVGPSPRFQITCSLTGNLPPIMGHRARFEQVVVNLITNARDAGASTIEISGALQPGAGRPLLRIAVSDDGPGIPAEMLPRLFKSFVTTKPSGKGTGLGLRICRRLIEEMGGTIAAANRDGCGAEFVIVLPVAPGDQL